MKHLFRSMVLLAAAAVMAVSCDKLPFKKDKSETEITFTVEVTESTSNGVIFNVTPSDNNATWAAVAVPKELIKEASTDQAKFEKVLTQIVESVGENTISAYMESILTTGAAQSKIITGLKSSTDYVLCVLAMNAKAERLSGVETVNFTTKEGKPDVDPSDNPGGDNTKLSFDITIDEVSDCDVTYSVTPSDLKATYICMLIDQEYMDKFTSDDAYFQDDMDYFKGLAEDYDMTLAEVMKEMMCTGKIEKDVIDDLDSETPYYIYCYGISSSYQRTTDIIKAKFTTKAVEKSDVNFNFECAVQNATATISVNPSDNSAYYYTDVWAASDFETTNYASEIAENVEDIAQLYTAFGYEVSDFCYKGAVSGNVYLDPQTEYVAFVVGLNANGKVNTDVTLKTIKSGDVVPSDNKITLAAKSVGSSSATIAVTTTTDEPYLLSAVKASGIAELTDEQITALVIKNSTDEDYGDIDYKYDSESYELEDLEAETKYVAVAFGCQGGIVTTALTKLEFTTTEQVAGKATISVDAYWFDGDEVYAKYGEKYADCKGSAFFCVDITTKDAKSYMWNLYSYEADLMDTAKYPDSALYQYVDKDGNTDDESAYIIDWNDKLILFAYAVDADGNKSEIVRQAYEVTKAGAEKLSGTSAITVNKINEKGLLKLDTKAPANPRFVKPAAKARVKGVKQRRTVTLKSTAPAKAKIGRKKAIVR